jgi:LytR cell envelope-related transcriptional attenuator
MGSMPFALSVHNFISSVGADAGFAAIIGLAVLVLLYFAHARDTANLHDEAEQLAHRLLQAEARIAQLSREQQAAPAVAPAPALQAARAQASSPIRASRGAAPIPAAPAGVGAPALAAATRVVPVAVATVAPPPSAAPAEVAPPEPAFDEDGEHAVGEDEREPAVADGARAMAAAAPATERRVGAGAPRPATAAGAAGTANGGSREARVAAPVAASARSGGPARPPVQSRPGAPGAPRRPTLPPRSPAPARGGAGRRLALLAGALIAVAAIAVLVVVTQSGGSNPSHAQAASTTNAPATTHLKASAAPFSPASVTVAVLNGTATNELAHRVAAKLTAQGYKQGSVATAPNQAQSATVVAFRPGFRDDALHVATALKLGPASVQPIDPSTQSVACPPPSACTANVVVTVGADLATL